MNEVLALTGPAFSAACCLSAALSCRKCASMTSRTVATSTPKYSCTRMFGTPRVCDVALAPQLSVEVLENKNPLIACRVDLGDASF